MDRALYVAMTGATQSLRAQAVNNHNLANASTTGFRAEIAAQSAMQVEGAGLPTRVNALLGGAGWDASGGVVMQTGNALDVSLAEGRWLAVQSADGREAYTRAGNLRLTSLGQLVTHAGQPVLGDGGPLSVPPNTSLSIGEDGTVSIVPQGQGPEVKAEVGRMKIVIGGPDSLDRGKDGLMYAHDDAELLASAGASLTVGTLESSNVNAADAMVNMINLSRQFEMQVRMMRAVNENEQAAQSIVRMR